MDPGISVKLKFWAMGDTPYDYSAGYPFKGRDYKCLRDTILPRISPSNPSFDGQYADFVVHVGDIMKGNGNGGVPYCDKTVFGSRQDLFAALEPDLDFFIVPGDNEWSECENFSSSPRPPPQSAEELWRSFFANPDSPFHAFDLQMDLPTSGASPPAVSRLEPNYPENFFFTIGEPPIAFFGINEPAGHTALDDSTLFADYNGDINAYWINTRLKGMATPPKAIAIFGHSGFSSEVEKILLVHRTAPVLYVSGNSHPDDYCLRQKVYNGLPKFTLLDLTVAPFQAGPLLVSIVEDAFGTHFFHVEKTPGCT